MCSIECMRPSCKIVGKELISRLVHHIKRRHFGVLAPILMQCRSFLCQVFGFYYWSDDLILMMSHALLRHLNLSTRYYTVSFIHSRTQGLQSITILKLLRSINKTRSLLSFRTQLSTLTFCCYPVRT